ncbi:5-oxoprolinase subunit C family protein [Peribacillus glennii]|uniref:Biotin-dependent carboxyltransferase family protein n=1 Tax=Peribacillus glennii TaxID=2303991 RepID=A0A372L998_9BACI|nr:biotin-dependent carboxyltransferase family protein [Peribacillus glennii]RFU62077.1 biotin-dependent carboxyltransferase family protein [Peribacillus glennii]
MITIIKPGILTSIQDLGRYGFQKYGVIASGAMDQSAHRIANLLVGNEENAATLEITLLGPAIAFNEDALISICGGDLSATINGQAVRRWRPVFVRGGSTLKFGPGKAGCRAYIAVAGGFDVPVVMNSKSTYLRAEIGGFSGRALKEGDQIAWSSHGNLSGIMIKHLKSNLKDHFFMECDWSAAGDLIDYTSRRSIRVMEGRQFELFTKGSQEKFFSEPFTVTSESDRMGYRLKGPLLTMEKAEEMISEAVSFGTIQVPSEGNPIVLLADRQTTGGYPKIGQIAAVDLPYLAQAKPGDRVYFTKVTLDEAQSLYLEQETKIKQLKIGVSLKFR